MRALLELYRANLTEFLSNRRALGLTVAFPVFFIVIFGLVFTNQDKQDAKIGIALEDDGPIGEGIATAIEKLKDAGASGGATGTVASADTDANPFSSLTTERGDRATLLERQRAGQVDAVVVIPAGLTAAAGTGQPAEVEMHIDPGRQTLIPFLQGAMSGVLDALDARVTGHNQVLNLRRVDTNARDLRTIDRLLPGILAMSLMQLGLFATAQPLIALRVGGVLKRLGATPLRRSTLLVAYVALRLTIAVLQTALILLIGLFLFKVKVVGSWWSVSAWLLLGTLMFLALGFFMAAVAKNEESAIAAANVINIPMLLLSGVFFPVNHLPVWLDRFVIPLVPLNYLADALRQVMVGDTPQHTLQTNALALGAWVIGLTLLAIWQFRWEESR